MIGFGDMYPQAAKVFTIEDERQPLFPFPASWVFWLHAFWTAEALLVYFHAELMGWIPPPDGITMCQSGPVAVLFRSGAHV